MSFNQFSFDTKIGVTAASYSAAPPLQHMSRRCIMNLSIKAVRIVGLASGGLFCTACVSALNNSVEEEGSAPLFLLLLS